MMDIAIGSKDDLRIRQDMWITVHQGKIDYVIYGVTPEKIPCRRCNHLERDDQDDGVESENNA